MFINVPGWVGELKEVAHQVSPEINIWTILSRQHNGHGSDSIENTFKRCPLIFALVVMLHRVISIVPRQTLGRFDFIPRIERRDIIKPWIRSETDPVLTKFKPLLQFYIVGCFWPLMYDGAIGIQY